MATPQKRLLLLGRSNKFDFYVDGLTGSDLNSGNSSVRPFATFAPLNAMSSLAGKRIGIAAGTYFDQLNPIGSNIKVSSYKGTARIDCRSSITSFIKTSGRTYVYEATITLPGDTKILGNAWENLSMLKPVASLALCDSTAGSVYVANWTLSSTTLYINPTAQDNPNTNGKTYLYSARSHGLKLTGSDCEIKNIEAIGNAHQDGSIVSYGTGTVADGVVCYDGARHNSLFGPNCTLRNAKFIRGRDDLEASAANGAIVYFPTITGTGYTCENCIFDQGDIGALGFTAIAGHGAPADQLFDYITYRNLTFIGLTSESGTNSLNTQIIGQVFQNCNSGFNLDITNSVVSISGGSGSINRLIQCSTAGTVNSVGGNYTVPILGQSSSVGFYRTNSSSGNVALNINGDKLNLIDGPSANSIIVYWQKGAINIQNMEVLPALAAKFNFAVNGGFSGGTITYTGTNNKWPFGTKWFINGTTYRTLAAVQAAGYEAGSTTQAFPTTVSSDDFNRPDENLQVSAGWTRVDGSAAMAAVRTNKLATLGTAKTFYRKASLASGDHWVRFTTSTNNGSGSYVVLAASDKDNFIGISWDTTTWYLAQKVAGTLTFPTTSGTVVPASGQDVVLARRGNTVYLYVNGDLFIRTDISSSLASNLGVGIVSHDTARNPWIDDFKCGLL